MKNHWTARIPTVLRSGLWVRFRWPWGLLGLLPLFAGCMATHLVVGTREPDLAAIQSARQRDQIEAVLGRRLWSAGVAEGWTYDIYQFKRHQPMRPISGTFLLGLDFFTAGLTEFDLADVKNFAPVKQLAVTYDAHDRIRHISAPWSVETAAPSRCLRSLVPETAGIPTNACPPPQTDGRLTNSALARLEFPHFIGLFQLTTARIDGQDVKDPAVILLPGWHTVDYAALHVRVALHPGRSYRLREQRYYPGYNEAVTIYWIRDEDSNETLGCTWPAVATPCPSPATNQNLK